MSPIHEDDGDPKMPPKRPGGPMPPRPVMKGTPPGHAAPPPPKPMEIIANHTVKDDETLSHISLKYYGSAYREAWIIIYEANRDVLGGSPEKFIMKAGQVLKIPKRPV